MMKKTLVTVMLILALALSVIGFSACGKDKIDENTNLSDLKSEKLADAAAWDAAFATDKLTNFSMKYNVSAKYGEENVKETVYYSFADDKAYFRGLSEYDDGKNNGAVVFTAKSADGIKVYTWGITDGKEDEAFLLTGEAAQNNGGEMYGTGKYGYDRINSIKDIKFENVTYSDEEKGYVYEQSENGSSVKGVIKFSDGRFVGVSSESSVGENKESFNLIVYNVGKTTVELPEAMTAEPAHTHTFATEWKSNENNHWHDCTVEGCTEKKDFAAHTWNDGEITVPAQANVKGEKTFTCTVCGKTKTEDVAALTAVTSADWTALRSELEKMRNASALTATMKSVSDGNFDELIVAYDKQTGKTVEKDTCGKTIGVVLVYPDNEKYVRIGFPVENGAVVNDDQVKKNYVPKEYGYKFVQDDINITDITESMLKEALIQMLQQYSVSEFGIRDQSGSRVSIGDNDIDLSLYVTVNNGVTEINGVSRVKSSAINGWRIEEEDSSSANTKYSTVKSLEIRYTLAFSDGCFDANMSMEAVVETSGGTDKTLGVYRETKYENSFDTALYNEMKELANSAIYSGEIKDVSANINFCINGIPNNHFNWLRDNLFGFSYTDKAGVWQKAQTIAASIQEHFENKVSVKIYLDKAHTREFTKADDITIDCVDGAELYFEITVNAGQNEVLVVKQYGHLDRTGDWDVHEAMIELVAPAANYALFDEDTNASERWSKITVDGAEHSLSERTIDLTGKTVVAIRYYNHVNYN